MTHYTDEDREELADLIAEKRDQYPRRPDDMDSGELAEAVLAWMEREGFRRSVVSTSHTVADEDREAG